MAKLLLASLATSSFGLQLVQYPQEQAPPRAFDASSVSSQSVSSLARQMGCSLAKEALSEQALFVGREATTCNAFEAQGGASRAFLGQGGVDYVSLIKTELVPNEGHDKKTQMAIWVSGYPRSGSSTLLSMVSATVDDNRNTSEVFSLFEPCHGGDDYAPWKNKSGCAGLLEGLAKCDFSGINDLWGWRDPHSTNNYTTFSADTAHDLCADADVVAFKTVDYGHDLKAWQWLFDTHPRMRILDVVRDPRGIFASWKVLEPFKSLIGTDEFYSGLTELCHTFANNIDFKDDRVHRIQFEELMTKPREVTKEVYAFLGMPYTEKQEEWVHDVFENTYCPPPGPGMEGFTDCHVMSESGTKVVEKWHEVLSDEEKAEFNSNKYCRRVAEFYGYPLDDAAV